MCDHSVSTVLVCVCPLTFLLFGVQLGDTDGEAVHTLLERVDPEGERVGLVKQLPKQVLCILTYTHTELTFCTMFSECTARMHVCVCDSLRLLSWRITLARDTLVTHSSSFLIARGNTV